ncbi:hypothetical protein PHYPSEUDO_000714 [Phytophthora pseudosyringae]|uniref:Uncharacterized protein n=1 Tax=Phytophthora pseudosyringae TaxID=221518 RepID=A0A8T1VYN8_9STRA|nr:hypothetical protein PHYPSEUDO_000714 [Phytophthora pseudosyringae]
MTFSSTLQLRIFGDHSLDKKLASPRDLAERNGDKNADLKMRCSISSDGKWPTLKREDVLLEGTHNSGRLSGFTDSSLVAYQGNNDAMGGGGLSGPLTIPVSSDGGVGSAASTHSDWHAISSNSFDDAYLESDYANGGMPLSSSSSSLNHLNEPMTKLALENEDHDLPVISMPYPGTSWFLSGKAESGFCLPSLGGLTPRSQALSSVTTETSAAFTISSCPPSFHSSGVDYSAGKLPGDAVSCPSDASSPVQMEKFGPCLPHTLEPSELLFEDISTWTGPPTDTYDNQHYHQQHGQPFYNVTPQPSAPNGYLYFDGASATTSSAISTSVHDYASSYQHHQPPASVSTGPSLYRLMQSNETFPTDAHWNSNQAHHHYSTSSTASTTPTDSAKNRDGHIDDHGNQQPSMSESLRAVENGQAIKRMLRSSTLNQRENNRLDSRAGASLSSGAMLKASNAMAAKVMPLPTTNPVSPHQSARIHLLTALNDCYWKNGRKNLQCFPSCPEHHDFYSMKMNNRKHSSVGVCRGPVYCHAFTDAAEFVPAASTQQMKHEPRVGIPSGGSNARELFVLGRFERVPQQDSTNLLEELNAPPSFPNAAVFEQFRFTCFQAVEMEERRVLLPEAESHDPSKQAPDSSDAKSRSSETIAHSNKRFIRSTWFFLPDVWKVQPMLKKKRKATRSAPAQTFPFCFRIFIYTRDLNGSGFSCTADTASSFFELYSTRTVDRVKRKYWGGEDPSDQRTPKQRGLERA